MKDLTKHEDLTRRYKNLTIQYNYLTSDGRNMLPYRRIRLTEFPIMCFLSHFGTFSPHF